MLKHPNYTRTRIKQIVNRLRGQIYTESVPVTLQVCGPTERISYDEAQSLSEWRPSAVGDQFGPTWETFWFRAEVTVPADWAGQRVDLLWDSQSEATLWRDGISIQGLNMTSGDRPDAIMFDACDGGEALQFQVEMACNRKFGAAGGSTGPAQAISPYHLRRCDIARFNPDAWSLFWDAYVLRTLEFELDKDGSDPSFAGRLLSGLNAFCNVVAVEDPETWEAGRAILKELYAHENATQAFELSAIGHAHIDTAWLWPLAETHRKCERTFSSQTAYMRDYPEYRFSCSQAYQYEMIAERNPDLYARIQHYVEAGQWVPVGGSWVEPDCNIPSGEALCRQFLFGQRYFEKAFGQRCKEFWNPDVFGYNGQLPQIMQESGITRFLTQKLSWNRFNTPDHHTFIWRGIDGSEVLTHFPPTDTYNAMGAHGNYSEVTCLRENLGKFLDHDRSNDGYMLYGYGDGGGGPTKDMLEVLRRAKDLQGIPRTTQRSPDEFFERLERNDDWTTRVGELYFEYHRGTYTSQAEVKLNNRRTEQLLHDLEFLATARGGDYPREALDEIWKILLLNQFHDILPGSSIQQVYVDSSRQFAEVRAKGEALRAQLLGDGDTPINTLPVCRSEVMEIGGSLTVVACAPYASGRAVEPEAAVQLNETDEGFSLSNARISATLDRQGRVTHLALNGDSREALDGPANVFEIYDDYPTNYDAWDVDPFHLETRKECAGAEKVEILRQDPLRAELRFEHAIGAKSRLVQIVRLDADADRLEFHTDVEWQENKRILKVAFPINAMAQQATYEMQFGSVERPTHFSNSFDLAKFEVPMHRWCDLSEHGYGVALLNDCKYGGSTYDNIMRLSLLRAPGMPDPGCDRGSHTFAYALMPHRGGWREAGVQAEAMRFNQRLQLGAALDTEPFASSDTPDFVIDTIKRAEDSDDLIIRGYECHGGRGVATLTLQGAVASAIRCNVLEDDGDTLETDGSTITVPYTPHELISIRVVTDGKP